MKHLTISAIICAICGITTAQAPISLKAAVDTALNNNLLVKNEQLKAQYQQMLINTATTLPKTTVMADAGQINSIYTDTRFVITQNFSLPKVYTSQKELLQQEWKSSLLNIAVKEALLKKQVAQVFYTMLYIEQKNQLLLYTDSLYTAFYKKAALRLEKGESNLLEKVSAETQLGQIHLQQQQLQQDMAVLQLHFQLLLNTTTLFVPEMRFLKMEPPAITDASRLRDHATMQLVQQQEQIAAANIAVEKSRLLPDLLAGYSNTSIKGTGADNKIYGSGKRFNAVQIGIGIPLFAKAQKEKISSAKFSRQIAEHNYTASLQNIQSEYEAAVAQFNKYKQTVRYFETEALKNASLIINTANQQLAKGNINYLEWVQLVNQSVIVKSDYTEAIKNLNESIIQLNYFNNQ
jgi:cobalt-zinc-cadmium resistance protein CzcA